MKRTAVGAAVAVLVLAAPSVALACPVCFGEVDGPMAEAVNNGILVMLGLVAAVQFGFIAMFVGFWRRAKRLREDKERFTVINGGIG